MIKDNRKFERNVSQSNPTTASGNKLQQNKEFDMESETLNDKKDK